MNTTKQPSRPIREPAIAVDPRPTLTIGDKVKLSDTVRRWTVRGVTKAGRFAILTQPFNLKRTVLYSVIDFDRGVRGRDNFHGLGYETDEQIVDALHNFQHTEDGDAWTRDQCSDEWCRGQADVSFRSGGHVRLDIEAVNGVATDWAGRS
jgi:hypothetical protein